MYFPTQLQMVKTCKRTTQVSAKIPFQSNVMDYQRDDILQNIPINMHYTQKKIVKNM
jgi:hypothetical protein